MKILQTPTFQRKYKKLNKNELILVNAILDEILEDVEVGVLKKGDLGSIRVHKKHKGKQEFLIAYWSTKGALEIIDMGSHENFYRDLKRRERGR
jgi:hypothetical protein